MPAWIIKVLETVLPTIVQWIINHYQKKTTSDLMFERKAASEKLNKYIVIKKELTD